MTLMKRLWQRVVTKAEPYWEKSLIELAANLMRVQDENARLRTELAEAKDEHSKLMDFIDNMRGQIQRWENAAPGVDRPKDLTDLVAQTQNTDIGAANLKAADLQRWRDMCGDYGSLQEMVSDLEYLTVKGFCTMMHGSHYFMSDLADLPPKHAAEILYRDMVVLVAGLKRTTVSPTTINAIVAALSNHDINALFDDGDVAYDYAAALAEVRQLMSYEPLTPPAYLATVHHQESGDSAELTT